VTTADIRRELDEMVDFPGLTNAFVFPIQTRIDMLQTGIQTDVGILVTGPELETIQQLTTRIAELVEPLPGTASAFAERPAGGRYVTLSLDRGALARYGLSIAEVHEVVRFGLGGATVTETVEGLERFPVTLRLPADWRDSPQKLIDLPFVTPSGATVTLGQVAEVAIEDGPPRIRTENTRPAGLVLVEVEGLVLSDWVDQAREVLSAEVDFPPGYAFAIKGQYEYLERATERLQLMIPVTLAIIVILLMLTFHRFSDVLLVLLIAPLSIAGGLWLMWLIGYQLSVGVAVGFIALAGLAAEVCVLMLVYLNQAVDDYRKAGGSLDEAIVDGAVRRVRPITMTQATVFLGLLPVMLTTGIGSEVMQRIAAPMIGGVFAVWLSALVILPAAYRLWHGRGDIQRG
jgi:Cu(I)/Ag(I) efflux system membrane protein CusA/SilA